MNRILYTLLIGWLSLSMVSVHSHTHTSIEKKDLDINHQCKVSDITCSQTVTSAFAPNGDLWRLWSAEKFMYFQISKYKGKHFSATRRVSS